MEQTNVKNIEIKRGDIFYAKLNGIGSVQCNIRPVMILSNNGKIHMTLDFGLVYLT